MNKNQKLIQRSIDKKLANCKDIALFEVPPQGWLKTMREALGMTTTQLAKRLAVAQPRVTKMESNESNLKISTFKKIAGALNCDFFYFLAPKDEGGVKNILQRQARQKAEKIIAKVQHNMSMENQQTDTEELVKDLVEDLLNKNICRIWDEE
jgi:predicted DNA-binding mobile mystery protein A